MPIVSAHVIHHRARAKEEIQAAFSDGKTIYLQNKYGDPPVVCISDMSWSLYNYSKNKSGHEKIRVQTSSRGVDKSCLGDVTCET